MPPPLLKLENVSRLLGDRWCLRNLSLDIMPGEVVAVVGANGAGKTTLLRLLSGSLAPTRGRVMLGDVDLYRQRDRVQTRIGLVPEQPALYEDLSVQTRIGLVPEQPALYEDLSVQAYLGFMGTLQGLSQARLAARVAAVVEECQLGGVTAQVIRTLSLGFRQRVSLAQARLHEPDLLILDEPTNGLDPVEGEAIARTFRRVSTGQTTVLSTHMLQDVADWCQRVVFLQSGAMIADERLEENMAAHDVLSLWQRTP
jgi:ABC-2 type transport system ATP-binding protein